MSALLRTSGVSVDFGGVQAVSDVDLDVPEGRLIGVIGPNGAGKTTFIDAISGFVKARGRIELGGREISALSPHRRARLGLARTWQSIELFEDLTVWQNLAAASFRPSFFEGLTEALVRPFHGNESMDRALGTLGISDLAGRKPSEITQAQRKLVGVARALATEPRVVCLDEPAAGLDIHESEQLGRHLREVVDGGTAILLVDHDMDLVLRICDEIYVLEFGKVIAFGDPDSIRTDPRVIDAYLGGGTAPEVSETQPTSDASAARAAGETGKREPTEATTPAASKTTRDKSDGVAPAERRHVEPGSVHILELDGLTSGYNEAAVIRNVGLTVDEGEVVALLGANGAGKTTTLRTISGVVKPMAGRIVFGGRDLADVTPSARARLGIAHVPEGRGIFFGLTVQEHFRLGHPGETLDAAAAYEYFPALRDLSSRRAGLLSGGEQQMLALGRALARRPKLLLLDELSLGLAPIIVERLLPVVRQYARDSGCGVLLVEQHVHIALEFTDRGYVLYHGEVILHRTGVDLRENQGLIAASYLGERPQERERTEVAT